MVKGQRDDRKREEKSEKSETKQQRDDECFCQCDAGRWNDEMTLRLHVPQARDYTEFYVAGKLVGVWYKIYILKDLLVVKAYKLKLGKTWNFETKLICF